MSAVLPIEEDPRFRLYTATAGQTQFAVSFPFQQDGDITLFSRDLSSGWAEISPVLYDIAGAGTVNGGMVTFLAGRADGEELLVLGTTVLDRLGSIVRDGRFNSRLTDDEFDRSRLIQQELRRDADRALKTDFGGDGLTIDPDIGDGDTLIRHGNRLSKGPNAADIAAAQGNAETAVAAAGAAVTAKNIAVESAEAAAKWATEDEDVPVASGLFSAYHWARKAAALVTNVVASSIHMASTKAALDDDDELGATDSADGWILKKFTLSNLIASIFKVGRSIANASFAAATFKLLNATAKALAFDITALSADRKIIMPNSDVDLGGVLNRLTALEGKRGTTGELTLSGTQFDVTSIPTDARSIKIKLNEVSFSAASTNPSIQIGTSAGIETSGYKTSGAIQATNASSTATYSESFRIAGYSTTQGPQSGVMELDRIGTSDRWVMRAGTKSSDASGAISSSGGYKSLPGHLDRIRITTAAGSATLSGSVEVEWEK